MWAIAVYVGVGDGNVLYTLVHCIKWHMHTDLLQFIVLWLYHKFLLDSEVDLPLSFRVFALALEQSYGFAWVSDVMGKIRNTPNTPKCEPDA